MTNLDALILWARTTAGRLAALWRRMTRPERVLSAVLGAWIVGTLAALPLGGEVSIWLVLGDAVAVAWFACPVLADALVTREDLRDADSALLQVNLEKPTGAPRVAEVPCVHGAMHRFVFSVDGWQLAGPAPDRRPEEARTS